MRAHEPEVGCQEKDSHQMTTSVFIEYSLGAGKQAISRIQTKMACWRINCKPPETYKRIAIQLNKEKTKPLYAECSPVFLHPWPGAALVDARGPFCLDRFCQFNCGAVHRLGRWRAVLRLACSLSRAHDRFAGVGRGSGRARHFRAVTRKAFGSARFCRHHLLVVDL